MFQWLDNSDWAASIVTCAGDKGSSRYMYMFVPDSGDTKIKTSHPYPMPRQAWLCYIS